MDNKKMNQLMMELYANPELKEEFIANPQKIMAEKGIEVSENIEIKVLEETKKTKYIVLPLENRNNLENLSDMENRRNKAVWV